MDIHEFENNLGDINNSCKDQQKSENKTDDDIEEMNPYAVNNDTIHSQEPIYNITKTIEEDIEKEYVEEVNKSKQNANMANDFIKAKILKTFVDNHNKKIQNKQMIENRRNDIMRSIASQNSTVMQRDRFRPIRSSTRVKIVRNNQNITPSKRNNLVTNHCFLGNHIRENIPVTKPIEMSTIEMPIPMPTIRTLNYQIREDPPSHFNPVNFHFNPVNELQIGDWLGIPPNPKDIVLADMVRYPNLPPVLEKPKEINLAEVVTGILQEILSGKLNSVENIIGKLRVDFEEKSVLTNSKKKNIILLNFEDDTMRPVLKIEDKYMDIIQQWYDDCELLLDIEETNVSIPEVITIQDISGVVFQDINYKFKEEYLNFYIPLVINNIISDRSIKGYEKKYFKKINLTNSYEQKESKFSGDTIILDMGILIPENIKPDTIETKNNKSSLNGVFWNFPGRGLQEPQIDPEILLKKHILDDVRKNEPSDFQLSSYNNVYEGNKGDVYLHGYNYDAKDDVEMEKDTLLAYNSEYNVLYPYFSDNCATIFDDNIEENIKETNISSVFVLINDKFLQTITIENPDTDILHVIKNHSEFGFVKLFGIETNNKDIVSFIEREFNKTQFNDIDEINKKLLVTSQYIEFANKHNNSNNMVSSEENLVKKYLNSKYTFDDDINHKMKASSLYDIIINSKVVKIDNDKLAGFRTRLSKYLKDIGLKKKRYNDGFYYYGIVEKNPTLLSDINSSNIRKDKTSINLEEIMRKRHEEYLYFTQTSNVGNLNPI
jgi:hypothetical protein